MSMQSPTQQNAAPGNPDPVRINFTFPAGSITVGSKVIGTIERTGAQQLELTRNNRLQWRPAVGGTIVGKTTVLYDINIKRGGREIRSFPNQLLLATKQGPYFPGFPQNMGAGFIQFEAEITAAGDLAAGDTLTVDAVFAASTQIVTS